MQFIKLICRTNQHFGLVHNYYVSLSINLGFTQNHFKSDLNACFGMYQRGEGVLLISVER